MPSADEWLRLKIYAKTLAYFGVYNRVSNFARKEIQEHTTRTDRKTPDFLTKFLESRVKYPEIVTDAQIAEYTRTNIGAGSDTTAILLRELVYRFLVDPESCKRFLGEIQATLNSRPEDCHFDRPITWTEGHKMPYFQACMKECFRIHPALGQLIPREVPKGGVELCGKFIPEGTIVGCNAWTIHRDKNFYGEDADEYKPERWMDEDQDKVRNMESVNFVFGSGPRVCVGKNIALLEINKFVPELFRRFELNLVDPARYNLLPGWLVIQNGLDVMLRKRELGRRT